MSTKRVVTISSSSVILFLLCLFCLSNVNASPYSEELDRSAWTTIDTEGFGHQEAFDGDVNSRWATGSDQQPGQTFMLSLGSVQNVDRLIMVTNNGDPNNEDYPRGYEIHTSLDGFDWGDAVKIGSGSPTHSTIIDFVSQSAAYIRITQTGSAPGKWWSIFELKAFGTTQSAGHERSAQLETSGWSASASSNANDVFKAIDISLDTNWSTTEPQQPGQSFVVDMGVSKLIDQVVMVSTRNGGTRNEYPRNIDLHLSQDGIDWGAAVSSGQGSYSGYTDIRFTKQPAQFMRFTQTGGDVDYHWTIYNLMVFGSDDFSPGNEAPQVSFVNPEELPGSTVELGSDIRVMTQATDNDGYVQFVSLYINDYLVGQKSLPPYEWDSYLDQQLANLAEGTYVLRVEATDDLGAVGTASHTFVVGSSETRADGSHRDIVTVLDRDLSTILGTPNVETWGDSYSVGDQCFCKTTFDHAISDIPVETELGIMTIRQACDRLGEGPGHEGRPLYNDIQCGNGPANVPDNPDWADEEFCPGQINVEGTEIERRLG
ncbi:MAG: discoidin domain-containing protein, partial [Granulosicoccus sp.]